MKKKYTIMMLHGMSCKPWVYENYEKYFRNKGYDCIAHTLLCHTVEPGEDPDLELKNIGLEDYTDQVANDILDLRKPVVLIGHSMGGLIAQKVAERLCKKNIIHAVVLLAPAPQYGQFVLAPSTVKTFWSVLTVWGYWRKPIKVKFKEACYGLLNRIPKNAKKEIYDKLIHESGKAMAQIGLWPLDPKKASKVDKSKIDCPIIILTGEDDLAVSSKTCIETAKEYGSLAEIKVYPGMGHWLMGEPNWEELPKDIENFLEGIDKKEKKG